MASLPTYSTPTVVTCQGEPFRLYIDEDVLHQRIKVLGERISKDYEGRRPILIGVLNGAFMFLSDLMRALSIDCEVDFLKLSSYGDRKVSSGQVEELKSIDANVRGRDVLVVEDIVDTGLSMRFMVDRMKAMEPASVKTVTLLHKPEATREEVKLDYVAFEVANLFVIGYGLDYGQLGRNLPAIYILDNDEEVEDPVLPSV